MKKGFGRSYGYPKVLTKQEKTWKNVGRKEREAEINKAWMKFADALDKIIDEYTNGFGDKDINELMQEFQEQIKQEQKNAKKE